MFICYVGSFVLIWKFGVSFLCHTGLTFTLVCISGFFTCGCYLVIGTILLVAVS